MKKTLLSFGRLVLLSSLTILPFISQAQVDGEFRTRRTYGGISGNTTWEVYNSSTGWASSSLIPGATDVATIRDGVGITSNASGINIGTLNVGQGNPTKITATIDANGVVNGLTIIDPGKLSCLLPTIQFNGSSTTPATATYGTYKITGAEINFAGANYNTATVTVSAAPTGGTTATAEAIINGGKITGINITNAGSGYTTFPTFTITGDGTGASWTPQIGLETINLTSGGSGYTTAPQVIAGSYLQIGNSTTQRTVAVGNLNFRNGAQLFTGGTVTQFLNISGDLTAITPISFRTSVGTSTANTNVTFNKTGTSAATGNFTFNNLTLSANTTVNVVGSFTVLGTTNLNGTGVLPVDLISFDAKKELNKVNINWLTASEVNNDKFEILKSNNGKDFTLLATVKAKGASSYTVVDNFPFNGSNYYKLLQYDVNGKVNEKGIRAINFDLGNQKDASTIFPNPIASSGAATIKFKTNLKPKKLSLISSQGQVVYTEALNQESESSKELKLKDQITPGVYFLNIEGAISKEVLKVIVQ